MLLLRLRGVVVNARFANVWDSGDDPGRSRWRIVRRAAIVVGSIVESAREFLSDRRWMLEADFRLVRMMSFS